MKSSQFEEGSPNASLAIIGEAPSYMEIQAGRPFVGPAGSVLEQCLHSAGITRAQCYITNLFPFQVFKNKEGDISSKDGSLLWTSKKGLTPVAEPHVNDLRNRLSRVNATVWVPMGGPATHALTGFRSIMKWRGSPFIEDRIRIIPTIHPAATMRGTYTWRYYIIADLQKARKFIADPLRGLPRRNLIIDPLYTEVVEFLEQVMDAKEVAHDIECYNHNVSCMSYALSPTEAMSIPLIDFDYGGHRWSEEEELHIWWMVAKIHADRSKTIIFQNGSFDTWFHAQINHILTEARCEDTMVAHSLMYPDLDKGLDMLCSLHTDEPYYKDDKKLWSRFDEDKHTFWRYNAKDSAIAFEVWDVIQPELHSENYWEAYRSTMDLYPIIQYMQTRGVAVDLEALVGTRERIVAQLQGKYTELNDVAEEPFNPLSPKQCMAYFYDRKGIKPYVNRKTGGPTADDMAMQRIIKRYGLREAKIVQEIRGLEKLKGTYLEINLDPDKRFHCSYNIRGTRFGRMSSSQTIFGTGGNGQNLPPEFKEFLVADEAYEV